MTNYNERPKVGNYDVYESKRPKGFRIEAGKRGHNPDETLAEVQAAVVAAGYTVIKTDIIGSGGFGAIAVVYFK